MRAYGKDKVLTVSDKKLIDSDKRLTDSNNKPNVSDGLEKTADELIYNDDESIRMTKLLTNFALSILSPDENKLCSSGKENLKNMAVIESAYLSARTAMPEEPGRTANR